MLFDAVKKYVGIHAGVSTYDEEIRHYIADAVAEMSASGVPRHVIDREDERAVTCVVFFVKACLGDDRSETDKYMQLFERKVFRLALEPDGERNDVGMGPGEEGSDVEGFR